jgi:hypothetical protein
MAHETRRPNIGSSRHHPPNSKSSIPGGYVTREPCCGVGIKNRRAPAQRAVAHLQATDYSVTVKEADVAITAAANAVLAEPARAAIARLREIDAERPALMAFLLFVQEIACERAPELPNDTRREGAMQKVLDAPLVEVRAEINKHFEALNQEHYDRTQRYALTRLWTAARQALRADPDAALPT